MRIFERFNQDTKCMICGTNNEGKAVLIGMDGTQRDSIEQAQQVHLDCISLRMAKPTDGSSERIIYQVFDSLA